MSTGEMNVRVIVKSNTRTRDYYNTGHMHPVAWTGTVTDVTATTISIVPLDVDRWFPLDPEIASCTLTFDRTNVTVTSIDNSPCHYT